VEYGIKEDHLGRGDFVRVSGRVGRWLPRKIFCHRGQTILGFDRGWLRNLYGSPRQQAWVGDWNGVYRDVDVGSHARWETGRWKEENGGDGRDGVGVNAKVIKGSKAQGRIADSSG
jgi:hypothetical protein